jgi:hypothetical protein
MTVLLALTQGTPPDHQGFGGATTDSISAGDERQHRPSDEPADAAHGIGTCCSLPSARSTSSKWTAALGLASAAQVVRASANLIERMLQER